MAQHHQDTPVGIGRWTSGHASDAGGAGISWSAVFAGATAAGALSLVLLLLGLGLGFTAVSPWTGAGAEPEAIGVGAILWLTLMQLAASGLGGYLAGRLRVRWANVHVDEVYFRDTAHGFLAWGVATLGTAALLGSVLAAVAGGTARAGDEIALGGVSGVAAVSAGEANGEAQDGPLGYYADMLFRPVAADDDVADTTTRREAARILRTGINREALDAGDHQYLAQRVAAHTALSPEEAGQRVSEVFQQLARAEQEIRQTLDDARAAAAYTSLWMFIALLIGAFVASYAATYGGRQRDAVPDA
jgi:hypothetical protein